MPLINSNNLKQSLDSLLVLGRGIDEQGNLSETGFDRARVAVDIARCALPQVIVFSGGRSWVQVERGIHPPSEGGAMLRYAQESMVDSQLPTTVFKAEEESTSTAENMVLSRAMLALPDSNEATLGILSDELHFSRGRVDHLAGLVFPRVKIVPFILENRPDASPAARREEKISAAVTRVAMLGVTPGNDHEIMQRQRILERGNSGLRRMISTLK